MQSARLFFALWPDAALRAEFCALARRLHRECGGRLIRQDNVHQTLVFLGNVATDSIVALCEQAAQLCLPAFTLEFGVTGYWRHHHIAWAAPVAAPQALRDLVAVLEQGLQEAGFRYDRRSGKTRYAPHVTLIRDARQPDVLPTAEIIWPVRDFVLIESVRGAKGPEYRVLETWRLNQPQTPSESTALKDGAA